MNVQDLEAVRRLNLPIKFFIVNNQGYASIRASQANYFRRLTGADTSSRLTLPDIVRQAEAYGLPVVRISESAELRRCIREALDRPGPVVCEVCVMQDEDRAPRVQSEQRPDGSMVSKPLEDMYPYLDREEFRQNMIVPAVEE